MIAKSFIFRCVKHANLLLINVKEIVEDLQAKNIQLQSQVKKITIENEQLIFSNQSLISEVKLLKENLEISNLE